MKKIFIKTIISVTLLLNVACSTDTASKDNNSTIKKIELKTLKSTYKPYDLVSVDVNINLSGNKDWVGVFPKGSNNDWENVIKWNYVPSNGTIKLNKVTNLKLSTYMPDGEYEVRLFFDNQYGENAVIKAKYSFNVEDNYIYPPDTKLTKIEVIDLARPETTAFEDISKASVIDPAFGTTITRMHHDGPTGYKGFLYPKSPFWNADISYIFLGYRLFYADTLVESNITKNLNVDDAYDKLGSPVNGFKWSNTSADIFYTLQGYNRSNNKFTFTKNRIIDDDVKSEVLFDFQKYKFEKIELGNGESHIDRYDRHVVFAAKKPNNDHIFALLCNIQKPKEECKIKELQDSTWGYVYVDDDNDGKYSKRSLYDWIDISPNGDHIVENKTINGPEFIDKKVKSVETAIFVYDINFENRQKITNTAGHGDIGLDEDGNQVYVQFEWLKDHYGIFSYNLDAPKNQREKILLDSTYGGGHISCQNFNRPGWCYISTKGYGKYYNEVFALKLDGSKTVNRFVQARSSYGPYAGVSPDGKRVIYLSNWDDDNKSVVNMYHAGLKR